MLAEEIKPYKRQNGLNSKIHLVVNEVVNQYGTPINFIVTDRSPADCKEAMHLIEHIDAKLLLLQVVLTIQTKFYLILI